MSEFNIGDKVYLEGKIGKYDESDNTYCVDYFDYYKETHSTVWVKNAVLHTRDDTYNEGLNDAWELAKKIVLSDGDGGYSCEELENIFGYRSPASVFKVFAPQEVFAKVKAYEEERNEIKVGDVVKLKSVYAQGEGIVTKITETNICLLYKNGNCNNNKCSSNSSIDRYFEKTGKHFDSIDEFMKS